MNPLTVPSPLTMPFARLYGLFGGYTCDCDPFANHAERCSVTPIYAELCAELGNPWRIIHQIVQDVWWAGDSREH